MNKKNRNIIICGLIGLFLGLTYIGFQLFHNIIPFTVFYKMELQSINNRMNIALHERLKKNFYTSKVKTIVLVVDDQTREEYPEYFDDQMLKRDIYADLIEKLISLKVKTIAIDKLFTVDVAPDSLQNDRLLNTIHKYKNVILGARIDYRKNTEGYTLVQSFNDQLEAKYTGIVNIERDIDEFVRCFRYSFPIKKLNFNTMKEETAFIPTLAVATINNYNPDFIDSMIINVKDQPELYINYMPHGNPFRQYKNIFEIIGNNSDEIIKSIDFKDKIVLIGDARKLAHDYYEVPVESKSDSEFNITEYSMPGVEVQANIIDTILNDQIIKKLDPVKNALIVIVLCILLGVLLGLNKGFKISILVFLVVVIGYGAYAYYLFLNHNLIVMMVYPQFLFCVIAALCWLCLYFVENKNKIYVYSSFKKYVSPEVAKIAADNIDKLSASRKKITILFSDIEGFTSITEYSNPTELSLMLNKYLSQMGKIVFKNEGTLDKYIGDAVMAFWGAPLDIDDPEFKACKAALEMQKETRQLNEEFKAKNFPEFRVRIGINTSDAMVGNFGGELFNYTAVGDGVNLASRLEGANKQFNTSVIISQNTFDKVKDRVICRQLGEIIVKGKSDPVCVYELLALKGDCDSQKSGKIKVFCEAVELFKQKKWSEAEQKFNEILEIDKDDKISSLYLQEIACLKENPPGDDWKGTLKLREK